jgi:hypothetical protein
MQHDILNLSISFSAIANNIIRAINNSRRTIVVISPQYIQSDFTRFEYQVAQTTNEQKWSSKQYAENPRLSKSNPQKTGLNSAVPEVIAIPVLQVTSVKKI